MKKLLSAIAVASCVLAFSTPSFATVSAQTTAGGPVTIAVTNVPTTTTTFSYTPSPNVRVHVESNPTNFAITSASDQTDTTTGVEYGTLSTSEGYAQRTKTVDAGTDIPAPPATTDPATLPTGTAWGWIGGS